MYATGCSEAGQDLLGAYNHDWVASRQRSSGCCAKSDGFPNLSLIVESSLRKKASVLPDSKSIRSVGYVGKVGTAIEVAGMEETAIWLNGGDRWDCGRFRKVAKGSV